jgi:hypothetical protein
MWQNYSSEFRGVRVPEARDFVGSSDVGFNGFALMLGFER